MPGREVSCFLLARPTAPGQIPMALDTPEAKGAVGGPFGPRRSMFVPAFLQAARVVAGLFGNASIEQR